MAGNFQISPPHVGSATADGLEPSGMRIKVGGWGENWGMGVLAEALTRKLLEAPLLATWQSGPPVTSPGHRPPYPQLPARQSQSDRARGPGAPVQGQWALVCNPTDRRVREPGAPGTGRRHNPPAGAPI